MEYEITIAAKEVGAMLLDSFCPACFHIKRKIQKRTPWNVFPSIFSRIDSYTKRLVHHYFDTEGCAPSWLSSLGEIISYIEPPNYQKFWRVDADSGVRVWGSPDGMLVNDDGKLIIVDYKTAILDREKGDPLELMYYGQLGLYGWISEVHNYGELDSLWLIYTEPLTTDVHIAYGDYMCDDSFNMGFGIKTKELPYEPAGILPLLGLVRDLSECEKIPEGRTKCPDCKRLKMLMEFMENADQREWEAAIASLLLSPSGPGGELGHPDFDVENTHVESWRFW